DEMVGGDLGANLDQVVRAHPELGQLALRLDLGGSEVLPLGARNPAGLAAACTELEGGVAVLLLGALGDDLDARESGHRHRHVLAGVGEHPGHPHLLRDHSGAHGPRPLYSLISTSTPAARSSFIRASTVCGVGSTMSSSRLCVRISNCSRLFLS